MILMGNSVRAVIAYGVVAIMILLVSYFVIVRPILDETSDITDRALDDANRQTERALDQADKALEQANDQQSRAQRQADRALKQANQAAQGAAP